MKYFSATKLNEIKNCLQIFYLNTKLNLPLKTFLIQNSLFINTRYDRGNSISRHDVTRLTTLQRNIGTTHEGCDANRGH